MVPGRSEAERQRSLGRRRPPGAGTGAGAGRAREISPGTGCCRPRGASLAGTAWGWRPLGVCLLTASVRPPARAPAPCSGWPAAHRSLEGLKARRRAAGNKAPGGAEAPPRRAPRPPPPGPGLPPGARRPLRSPRQAGRCGVGGGSGGRHSCISGPGPGSRGLTSDRAADRQVVEASSHLSLNTSRAAAW